MNLVILIMFTQKNTRLEKVINTEYFIKQSSQHVKYVKIDQTVME